MSYDVTSTGFLRLEIPIRQMICAHSNCAVGTTQTSRGVRRIFPVYMDTLDAEAGIFEKTWSCDYCKQVTIEVITCGAARSGSGSRKVEQIIQLWPGRTARELAREVPEPIRDRFQEGSRCEGAAAYRGAAAMYRAAVEELCKDRGATKYKLYDKIEELRGQLDDDLIVDLHETRMLGNDGVHDGLAYSPEEVADVAELIVEMTEALYVAPAKKAAMRQARKQRRDAHKNGETLPAP
ncbi:DUF4145 domain-containing protein [Nonomuraea sp. NPDC005650]|uniref:DUF4145 domain-containing protein n=1 Tax=Nonomuraea sp. NPDC005650 TaxID=3157045 RepID=UPI0033BFA133